MTVSTAPSELKINSGATSSSQATLKANHVKPLPGGVKARNPVITFYQLRIRVNRSMLPVIVFKC